MAWAEGSRCMPFAIPMVWREPTEHVSYCYFCLTSITVTAKSIHTVQYPNLPSVMRPVPNSAELPVPKPPTNMTLSDSESSDEDVGHANNNMDCDPTFAGASSSSSVMEVLGQEINPDQWRLFTDSSKVSLKAVLLHNGNKFPPFLWLMQPT